jgi:uncharacterized protein (TIGR02118 family)
MATEAFKKVGDDFKNFATGGLVGLFAVETGDKSETACPALVTVIYHAPKDPAAFESYYPTHLKIVSDGQSEIGFDRADLTKFVANLDGSAPAEYRQAELCFPSMDALKKGTATPAFKKVGGDFKNFATGGLAGMIGEQKLEGACGSSYWRHAPGGTPVNCSQPSPSAATWPRSRATRT